jgi:perosamine synthetase
MSERIPLAEPRMFGAEAPYLAECVATNWVSSAGPFVDRFERELARIAGVRHAVACASGTAAIHVALLAAGVEPDDEVLVPDLTFVATAAAVRYCGAWPVLMDAEPVHWQMDVGKALEFLERECLWQGGRLLNRATRRRVRAVLPVHLLGHPVDMAPLREAAGRLDLAVVADAAEARGAGYRGEPIARAADVAAVSFNGNKVVTAGGGGAVLTDDGQVAARVRYLTTQAKDDAVEGVHGAIGFNYRLTNLQAAVGVAQLEHLDECLASKRRSAAHYARTVADLPVTLPREAPWAASSWWLYTVLVDEARFGLERPRLLRALAERRIETRPLWAPVSTQKPFAGCQAYRIEHAPDLHRRSLSLPSSVGITPAQLQTVTDALREIHGKARP